MVTKKLISSPRLILICCALLGSASVSGRDAVLVYYTPPFGDVSVESRKSLLEMKKIAARSGYITVWAMLDYPFNVYMSEMSEEELAAQSAAVAVAVAEVADPIVEAGEAVYPATGPWIKGPGFTLRVTELGLEQLAANADVVQITAARYE